MKTHNIASARFARANDTHHVIAITDDGFEITTHVSSDVQGGMVAYLSGGGTISAYVPPVIDLVKYKAQHSAMIDADAENFRLKFITPGDGMAMTYREKFEQAKAAAGQGQTAIAALTEAQGLDAYPTLMASVGIEAATLWDVAQLVITKAEAWADLSYNIERKRLSGKASVAASTTPEEVLAAYSAVTWG